MLMKIGQIKIYIKKEYLKVADELSSNKEIIALYQQEVERDEQMEAVREFGYDEGVRDSMEQVAKSLLAKNMPIDEISEVTGLTKEAIENLK